MNYENFTSRRMLLKSSFLGLLVASIPNGVYSKNIIQATSGEVPSPSLPHDRYPAIPLEIVSQIVGVAHFDLEALKKLVDKRPELAKANWDWGFGDRESAIAAASHVGRKDIVDYLVSKGAVPTIFTYAMLGAYDAVKTMILAYPGIQKNHGPHGISLLQHAKTGLQAAGVNKVKAQLLVDYLQSLGDADGQQYENMHDVEKTKYIGDYKYGTGENDGFTVKLNMRKLLSLGKPGKSGGALLQIGNNEFTYQGAPSVTVKFLVQNDKVISLTVTEPDLILTATKT